MKKIEALQDLRGIAIIMVVLFHAGSTVFGNYNIFMHGKNGVLLFFIVSGFIIASIHKNDIGFEMFVLFLKKRAIRIYLPYFPIFFVFLLLFNITGKGTEYHHDIFNIIKNFFLIQNPTESIHPYSWTLVYEMFYYATFAIFSILFGWSIYIYICIIITPIVISSFLGIYYDESIIFTSFYNLYFLAGVLISYYYENFKKEFSFISVVLLLFIFLIVPFLNDNKIVLFISTVLFFLGYLKRDKSNKVLNIIGNASFSIYLVHALVISIGKHIIPDLNFIKFLSLVFFSFIFGYIYHTYFENKIVKDANKIFIKRI